MDIDLIEFKSIPEFWEKEKEGIKNNTVREFEDDDIRFEVLDLFAKGENPNLEIRLFNTKTKESFERKIKDVSIYAGLYIITW